MPNKKCKENREEEVYAKRPNPFESNMFFFLKTFKAKLKKKEMKKI